MNYCAGANRELLSLKNNSGVSFKTASGMNYCAGSTPWNGPYSTVITVFQNRKRYELLRRSGLFKAHPYAAKSFRLENDSKIRSKSPNVLRILSY